MGAVVSIMQAKTEDLGKHCSREMLDRTYKGNDFCFAVCYWILTMLQV